MKLTCALLFLTNLLYARDYIIYSISHDVPMTSKKESFKNYFINMGKEQGVKQGTTLDVFRNIATQNPYDNQNRINFKVKIGELEVIHSEDDSSITKFKNFTFQENKLSLEVSNFMIGDHVNVKVNE